MNEWIIININKNIYIFLIWLYLFKKNMNSFFRSNDIDFLILYRYN